MKLPDTLVIGHQTFTLKVKDKEWMRDAERYGHCDVIDASMSIVTEGLSPNAIINTLIHETLHAIWKEYALPTEPEEHVVTCLANGLTALIRDNPEFLTLMKKVS